MSITLNPPQPSQTPHFATRIWFLLRYPLVALAVAIIVSGLLTRAARARDKQRTLGFDTRLQTLSSVNNLLQQQLDETFTLTAALTEEGAVLSETQQALFNSWLRFDEQYLNRIRREPASLFTQANVHSRRGRSNQFLGMHEQALIDFRAAIGLLEKLYADYPGIPSYAGDLVAANFYAAKSAKQLGLPPEDILTFVEAAIEALRSPSLHSVEGLDNFADYLQSELTSLRQANQ